MFVLVTAFFGFIDIFNKINNYVAASDITLSKKQFVFEHSSENIRDDYLIGKVLGTGNYFIRINLVQAPSARCDCVLTGRREQNAR